MDPAALPEDLSTLSEQELTDLLSQISARGEEIAAADDISDAEMAELEALTEAKDRLDAEIAARQEMSAEKQARVEASLAKLRGDKADEAPESDQGEALADEKAEEVVPVAATTEASSDAVEELTDTSEEKEEAIVPDEVTQGGSAASLAYAASRRCRSEGQHGPDRFLGDRLRCRPGGHHVRRRGRARRRRSRRSVSA